MPPARGGRRALSRLVSALAVGGRVYRVVVTSGRWFVVAAWVALAIGVTVLVPATGATTNSFGDLLPADSPVLATQRTVLQKFRVPVLSGTTVVVHKPGGLNLLTRADSALYALATTQNTLQSGTTPPRDTVVAAIPVPTGSADTTVTYLYFSEGTGLYTEVQLARQYASHFHNQAGVQTYVTGFVPGQIAQGDYLNARLPLFELASLVLIVTVVALAFRSVLAPIAVVAVAGVGYLVYNPLLSTVARVFAFDVPSQLEPVLLALLLGVTTDYCVLFFSSFRTELDRGAASVTAARRALRLDGSVVAVAGLTVAGGTVALLAAPFAIFRALGPALVLTVLVGVLLCLTLTPALMTILGWRLFTAVPVRGSRLPQARVLEGRQAVTARPNRALSFVTARVPAVAAAVLVVGVLGLAASPLAHVRLDLSFTAGLPDGDSAAQGARLLDATGLRGISAPTEVLVQDDGIVAHRPELARLQSLLAAEPGVVRVIGPADSPLATGQGLVLSQDGDAARFIVVFGSDPLAATAIGHVRTLQDDVGRLAEQAGLGQADVEVTGQTLIASEVARLTGESLAITLVVALAIELVILSLYLRAVVAPVVLLACSALSVAAALGLTTLVFQQVLGEEGLTFYAPFASAVLLIALGADYTVFSVGSIWSEARRRPLREALLVAVPRSSVAITIAGVILAGTFALVSIIPLSTFRQIAFAMAVGLLLDTLVIRPVLTPAVLTLLGRRAGWPSKQISRTRRPGDVPRGAEVG